MGMGRAVSRFHRSIDALRSAFAFEEISVLAYRRHFGFSDQDTRANDRRTCLNWELPTTYPLPGISGFSGGFMTP